MCSAVCAWDCMGRGGAGGSRAWGVYCLCIGSRLRHLLHCDSFGTSKKTEHVEQRSRACRSLYQPQLKAIAVMLDMIHSAAAVSRVGERVLVSRELRAVHLQCL